MKALNGPKKHRGNRSRVDPLMKVSGTLAESREVSDFVRRHGLGRSVLATRRLVETSFGDHLAAVTSAVVTDVDEADEVDQALVVDIGFRGDGKRFHEMFKAFTKKWVVVIAARHQKLIQFRFHIGNE